MKQAERSAASSGNFIFSILLNFSIPLKVTVFFYLFTSFLVTGWCRASSPGVPAAGAEARRWRRARGSLSRRHAVRRSQSVALLLRHDVGGRAPPRRRLLPLHDQGRLRQRRRRRLPQLLPVRRCGSRGRVATLRGRRRRLRRRRGRVRRDVSTHPRPQVRFINFYFHFTFLCTFIRLLSQFPLYNFSFCYFLWSTLTSSLLFMGSIFFLLLVSSFLNKAIY